MESETLPGHAISTQTRKALLIGVRYFGSPSLELICTHDDVLDIRKTLINHYGYKPEDITMMLDTKENEGTDLWPNSDNILAQMVLLLDGVKEGDRRCFMFAGHGWPTFDEKVGEIQAIVPVDGLDEHDNYLHEHLISAQEMGALMVAPLPENGCAFTAIIDCCNSSEILGFDPASLHSSQKTDSSSQDDSAWDTSSIAATFASSNISDAHSLAEDLLRASTSNAPVEVLDIIIDSAESQDVAVEAPPSPPSGLGLTLQPGENDQTPMNLGDNSSTTLVPAADVFLAVTPPVSTHWEDTVMTEDSDFLPVTDAELATLSASATRMELDEDPFATPMASKSRLEPGQGTPVAGIPAKPSTIICWSSRTSMVFEYDKGLLSEALGEALENPQVVSYRDMYTDVRRRLAESCQKLNVKQSVQLARLRAFDYDQEMVL